MVQIPGHVAIDLTPDVIAAIAEVQTQREGFETIKESIGPEVHGRDVPTHVQFT